MIHEAGDQREEDFADASGVSDALFCLRPDQNGGRQVNALLVEDDRAIRQMIENYLTENNMRVASATDRNGVVRHFTPDEPSLVILDLQLGKDDGLDLLRAISLAPTFLSSSPLATAAMKSTGSSAWS
jgi:CheY-like chemotaxis protein